MKLLFNITNQHIERVDNNHVVADSKNYLTASFQFSSDWDEAGIKTVIFSRGKEDRFSCILENDSCVVPWEVIKPGTTYVSVFAGNLITTDKCPVRIADSGYAQGQTPQDPTSSVYEQIIQMVENLQIPSISEEQIREAIDEYLEDNPITSIDQEEIILLIDSYISENANEFKGDKGDTGETGPQGIQGPKGDKGDPGNDGQNGINGVDGVNGSDGASAYDIAVDNGFVGTEQEWLESLKGVLPPFASSDNGKILGIINGQLAWVLIESAPTDPPIEPQERPSVPQTGTWQLKQTTDKKFLIIGTDDDIQGNAKFFRMLRTYGFPYTMNTESEFLTRQLTSDNDSTIFTSDDAPALFPNGCTVADLGKYLAEHPTLGETAQHGSSSYVLWDSSLLTGSTLTTIYNAYTTAGGTKTEQEFKEAVMLAGKSTDISQGASYVADARELIEDAIGDYVYTAGVWGGEPEVVVDGITVNLLAVRRPAYDWRANNYSGASTDLTTVGNNTTPYDIKRDSSFTDHLTQFYENVTAGRVAEIFIHNTTAFDYDAFREKLDIVKGWVNDGTVQVITRKQYADLGEYVSNPVVSISVTRNSNTINVGDTDSDSNYTVIATFADSTTADVTGDSIVKYITDTSEAKIVDIPAYYKGITNTVQVEVSSGSSNILQPTVLANKKLDNTTGGLAAASGGKVYAYDVTGLSTLYFTSSHNHQYKISWTMEYTELGEVDLYQKPYFAPKDNPNEITVPVGMNYLYINSNTTEGYDVYPWSIAKIASV